MKLLYSCFRVQIDKDERRCFQGISLPDKHTTFSLTTRGSLHPQFHMANGSATSHLTGQMMNERLIDLIIIFD
jgi:hypothetical protein